MKTRPIPFAEFRAFLYKLGYTEKRVPKGRVFQHPAEGLLLFRYYGDAELVSERDLRRTQVICGGARSTKPLCTRVGETL